MMDLFLGFLMENAGDETRAPYVSFDEDYVNQPAGVDYMVYQVSMVMGNVASHLFWLAYGKIDGQYGFEVCVPGYDEDGHLQPVVVSKALKEYLEGLVTDRYEEWLPWDNALRLLEEHNLPWWRIEQLFERITGGHVLHPLDEFDGNNGLYAVELFVEDDRDLARLALLVAEWWASNLRGVLYMSI